MAILDPDGLFSGERLAALSDKARVYWPWIYSAANSFARLEFNARNIANRCFSAWTAKVSEQQIVTFLAEYEEQFLLFTYNHHGQRWIQFDTPSKFLPAYHSKKDKATPAPTPQDIAAFEAGLSEWRRKRTTVPYSPPQLFENLKTSPHGIGTGIGIGDGTGKDLKPAPTKKPVVGEVLPAVVPYKTADPRHSLFREELRLYWSRRNTDDMPWDGSDARQLSALLKANPKLTPDAFRRLLAAREQSEVNHSERIRIWIARATDYGNGPLNTFNKPKLVDGGGRKKAEKEQEIHDTASNFAQTDRIFGINQGPAEVRTPQVVPGQVRALLEPPADNAGTDSGLVRRDPALHG